MTEKSTEKNYAEYKVILIGNSHSGKTSFFKKITKGVFNDRNISSIGTDKSTLFFQNIEININNKITKEEFNIIIFDSAGQDRYRSLAKSYFNTTDIVIIFYDITNRRSFEDIGKWLDDLKDKLSDWKTGKYLIALLGNHLDLVEEDQTKREVTKEEVKSLCEDFGIYWAGECNLKSFSQNQLTDMLLNIWKKYVEKFGIKEAPIKIEPKLMKKKNKCH